MTKSSVADLVNYRATANRVAISPVLFGLIGTIAVWIVRRRQRWALAELDKHLLNDVGLSPQQARRESAKPFWKR
jgi:uncharacterized protein YjiS (DUF1127 family)